VTPAPEVKGTQSPLRVARVMWWAFLVSAAGDTALAYFRLKPHAGASPQPAFLWAFAVIAALDIVVIGAFRRSALSRSEAQSMRGEAAAARHSWFSSQILGFAGGMSVVLFGFVLYLLGAQPAWVPAVFFVAGMFNLAAYYPKLEENR
jgi:hypothetical protein